MEIVYPLLALLIGAGVGISGGYFLRKKLAQAEANSLEAKAETKLTEAKNKAEQVVLEANQKANQILEESKREEKQRREELHGIQQRLERRESTFDQKLLEIQDKEQKLQEKIERVKQIKEEVERVKEEQVQKLQQVAELTKDNARLQLLQIVEEESKNDLMGRILKLEKENQEVFDDKAKEIVIDSMQRCAASHSAERTSSLVTLPSEEMKGRIIGKEGRNIKTIEKLTGCELIIDETPDSIIISGFSPIRREVARMALEKLILDGRIQPARIEEFIEKAKQELSAEIRKAGEEALYKMGITGIDPKLVMIIGRA
jgi:ribonuclease Y